MVQTLWKTVWQVVFVFNAKHRLSIWLGNSTPRYISKRIPSISPQKNANTNVRAGSPEQPRSGNNPDVCQLVTG